MTDIEKLHDIVRHKGFVEFLFVLIEYNSIIIFAHLKATKPCMWPEFIVLYRVNYIP